MRNEKDTALTGGGHDVVQQLIGQVGVQTRGRLVQDQDVAPGQERSGHHQPSALTAGHGDPFLANRGVDALGQRCHPFGELRRLKGGGDVLIGGIGATEHDIGPDGPGEELRALIDQGHRGAHIGLTQLVHRLTGQ